LILGIYNLALFAGLLFGLPWWLVRMATTRKYREGLFERLGWTRSLADRRGRPLIWIHAVSVGEVIAVSRLVERLIDAQPDHFIAVSTTTRTGQELARQRFGEGRVFYCPLDLPWAVRAHLNALRPSLLILVETEFWPNLLTACARRAIPVAVVNARISDRSWPRYRALRLLWRPLLNPLACVMAQTLADARRLQTLGCRADRLLVSGNLKFDVRVVEESEATRLLRQAAQGKRVVVAGSTLEGEEAALITLWPSLAAAHADIVLVIAPRHPERFAAVAALLGRSTLHWQQRSRWRSASGEKEFPAGHVESPRVESPKLESGEVLLLDSIGELSSVYSLASIAFVGGSLVAAGGHNPLEPAQFAVPVVMGPSIHNFRAIVESLLARDAIRIVERNELYGALDRLLSGGDDGVGARAREVFDRQAGATERTLNALQRLLAQQRLLDEERR